MERVEFQPPVGMILRSLTFVLSEVIHAVVWLIDLFNNFSNVGVFLSKMLGPWLLFHDNAAEYDV